MFRYNPEGEKFRDYLNRLIEKIALERANSDEITLLLGCSQCGCRMCDWDGDNPVNPKGKLFVSQTDNYSYCLCFNCEEILNGYI